MQIMAYTSVTYPMIYGDRVFARVMRNGRSVCELTLERVSNYTEVIGEIRHMLRHLRGLVQIVVRNFNRGWSLERPLMLYGDFPAPRRSANRTAAFAAYTPPEPKRMFKPWETL